VVTNLEAGSNITITTTTPGKIVIASTGGGSITGSGTPGFGARWSSATALAKGALIDDGTVLGYTATSSSYDILFKYSGDGSRSPLNVTDGSNNPILTVSSGVFGGAAYSVGIGTTTPLARLVVQAAAAVNPFIVASSSGASILTVTNLSRVGIGSSTPSAQFVVDGATTNATTSTIFESYGTKGHCIRIKDSDGTGYTYVYANNGVLTASTVACD
jgi:hypothetical protein